MEMLVKESERILNSVFDVDYDDDAFDSIDKKIKNYQIQLGVEVENLHNHIAKVVSNTRDLFSNGYDALKSINENIYRIDAVELHNIRCIYIINHCYDFNEFHIYSSDKFQIGSSSTCLDVENLKVSVPELEVCYIKDFKNSVINCNTFITSGMYEVRNCEFHYKNLEYKGVPLGFDKALNYESKYPTNEFGDWWLNDVYHQRFLEIKEVSEKITNKLTKSQAKEFLEELYSDEIEQITIIDPTTITYKNNEVDYKDTIVFSVV